MTLDDFVTALISGHKYFESGAVVPKTMEYGWNCPHCREGIDAENSQILIQTDTVTLDKKYWMVSWSGLVFEVCPFCHHDYAVIELERLSRPVKNTVGYFINQGDFSYESVITDTLQCNDSSESDFSWKVSRYYNTHFPIDIDSDTRPLDFESHIIGPFVITRPSREDFLTAGSICEFLLKMLPPMPCLVKGSHIK